MTSAAGSPLKGMADPAYMREYVENGESLPQRSPLDGQSPAFRKAQWDPVPLNLIFFPYCWPIGNCSGFFSVSWTKDWHTFSIWGQIEIILGYVGQIVSATLQLGNNVKAAIDRNIRKASCCGSWHGVLSKSYPMIQLHYCKVCKHKVSSTSTLVPTGFTWGLS